MINSDDGEWLTYQQAAKVLGLPSPEAVRSLARRRGWSRQSPNEIGAPARVQVPTGFGRRSQPAQTGDMTGADRRASVERPSSDSPEQPPVDRAGLLAVEVALLRERIADKDAVIDDLRQRLDAADRRLDVQRDRADQVERRLADKDATITGLVAEQQAMRQQVETLTELLRARRSWWRRVTGR